MLHPQNPVPITLMPNDKPLSGSAPINNFGSSVPTPARSEFPPPVQPTQPPLILTNNQPPVFSGLNFVTTNMSYNNATFNLGQDVDLRSLDPRTADPRLSRSIGDQDMRTIPAQLPNPLPPVGETLVAFTSSFLVLTSFI